VAVLGQRVLHHRGEGFLLAAQRDDLPPDRVVRIVGVDQAGEVGRDVDAELVRCAQALALFVGQVEHRRDFFERVDPVRKLPAPVIPLLVGDVRPEWRATADGRLAVRTESACRIALVDERNFGQFGASGCFHGEAGTPDE
jgi:hypothetical protein